MRHGHYGALTWQVVVMSDATVNKKDTTPTNDEALLTKGEAAERLGLSERAVARHAEAGRLHSVYQSKEHGGSRVFYRASEVDELRELLAQPRERKVDALAKVDDLRQLAAHVTYRQELVFPLVLTIHDAAELIGFGVHVVETAIRKGELIAFPFGPKGSRVVARSAVIAWASAKLA